MSGLEGRSIVITRSRAQAEPFAQALSARGAIPILFPTIEIRPLDDCAALDDALAHLDQYDWIVFTSANTVSAVWERLRRSGEPTSLAPGGLPPSGLPPGPSWSSAVLRSTQYQRLFAVPRSRTPWAVWKTSGCCCLGPTSVAKKPPKRCVTRVP
jgi:hypothetical protein